jgi:hypothetical protein
MGAGVGDRKRGALDIGDEDAMLLKVIALHRPGQKIFNSTDVHPRALGRLSFIKGHRLNPFPAR